MAMRPQDRYKSTTAGAVSANRNYKDTVFRMLFSDKKNLLSLYNAVHSREGCYTYIKEIIDGNSIITLAEEEQEALKMAKESTGSNPAK